MSASSKLSNNKLTFTATDASTGDIEFGTSGFSLNKAIAMSGGMTVNQITVESGSIEVANQSDLKLSGATSGTATIKPAAVTTDHTLTLPSDKGDAGSFLQDNGSGVLSWFNMFRFSLQGALLDVDPGSTYVIPLSSVVDASSSTYPKLTKKLYDPDSLLSSNVITVNASGYWQINIYIHHTINNIDTSAVQEGTGTTTFKIRFNGASTSYGEYLSSTDSESGTGETCVYSAIVHLDNTDYFDIVQTAVGHVNEDYIIRMGLLLLKPD